MLSQLLTRGPCLTLTLLCSAGTHRLRSRFSGIRSGLFIFAVAVAVHTTNTVGPFEASVALLRRLCYPDSRVCIPSISGRLLLLLLSLLLLPLLLQMLLPLRLLLPLLLPLVLLSFACLGFFGLLGQQ